MQNRRLLLNTLVFLVVFVSFFPSRFGSAQEAKCYTLSEVAHVGPLNINQVVFEGTNEDFRMTYSSEHTYPKAQWEVHVRAGTADYSQPTPPASMKVKFTPPYGSWCVGEEKRFAISGKVTEREKLAYRYTPRFNYSTVFQLTTTKGINPFENVIVPPENEFSGDGGLRLLNAAFPEIKIEYLVGTAFGELIVEYRYKQVEAGQISSVNPLQSAPPIAVISATLLVVLILWLLILLFR